MSAIISEVDEPERRFIAMHLFSMLKVPSLETQTSAVLCPSSMQKRSPCGVPKEHIGCWTLPFKYSALLRASANMFLSPWMHTLLVYPWDDLMGEQALSFGCVPSYFYGYACNVELSIWTRTVRPLIGARTAEALGEQPLILECLYVFQFTSDSSCPGWFCDHS